MVDVWRLLCHAMALSIPSVDCAVATWITPDMMSRNFAKD